MAYFKNKITDLYWFIRDYQTELLFCGVVIYALYGLICVVGGVNMRV